MKSNEEIQALLDTAHRDAGLPEDVEFSCRDYYPTIGGPPADAVVITWYVPRDGKEYGEAFVITRDGPMEMAIKHAMWRAMEIVTRP